VSKYVIPFKDYERIFKTIYSILKSENAKMEHSCLYYSIYAAKILQQHYKLEPKVHAGVAFYRVGKEENQVLGFADQSGDNITCTKNGFHCWVEVKGFMLDFMAPIFPEIMKKMGQTEICSPYMFQKCSDLSCSNPSNLSTIGDFFVESYPNVMEDLLNNFSSKQANIDLVEICSKWYKKPPKKMMKTIPISNGKGIINDVAFSGKSLVGAW